MKPPIEYRQPRPASSSGRTAEFGSAKPGSNPGTGTKLVEEYLRAQAGTVFPNALADIAILKHKRAVKAAQMRRYRANKKAGK